MNEVIEREEWDGFIKDFNHRNEMRATSLEILGREIGAQEEEQSLPFTGISLETKGTDAPRVEITLGGETAKEERQLTHTISRVRNIMTKMGADLREEALLIEDEEGNKTILSFKPLPEIEAASNAQGG
jgi:phenylalanyl-tRNA synthetase alpha subunit